MEEDPLPALGSLADLDALVAQDPGLCVRYSRGYDADREGGSLDAESGLELPGLSANPLAPEPWWTRPRTDWLARQLCQYRHLMERNPDRFAWVLRGRVVGRGPDCEPLLADVVPVARLAGPLLEEAQRAYEERFDAGAVPDDR